MIKMNFLLIIFCGLFTLAWGVGTAEEKNQGFCFQSLLPGDWDPKVAGDRVLKQLITVTPPQVKGAHDSEMVLVDGYAFIVAEVNDRSAGESAHWPHTYVAMSIVNIDTLKVEQVIPAAKSEQIFKNEKLPEGAYFVPRIIRKDPNALRCYFASERPGIRQSQMWYRDFDITSLIFDNCIYHVKIKTSTGIFDMQPRFFYEDAVFYGFKRSPTDHGLYIFDSFKIFNGEIYFTINNFPGRQNALTRMNRTLDTFEIIGHYNEPQEMDFSESAVNQLPSGTWMAILRSESVDHNCRFTTSKDGKTWSVAKHHDFVQNGTSSKPTFDKFGDIYYLGWQEETRIDGVYRSVFNVDVSRDGKNWQRKFRFETTNSFQYPSFHEYNDSIWVCVTQGSYSNVRKERIMFGKLE